ncbi:MAG: cyclic lactone autoinducer peptide [Clostridia bacterium]|nr:cyclic lactone autoinducer peptide [Clostridia bacterium]
MKTRLMISRIFQGISVLVVFLATIKASSACVSWFYQPKVPKCLKK